MKSSWFARCNKFGCCLQSWDSGLPLSKNFDELSLLGFKIIIFCWGRLESQLWRWYPNLILPGNQDELRPKQFYYSGFISELQRFVWDIGSLWNLNSFGVLQFPKWFALQITWTVECYEPSSTAEKLWDQLLGFGLANKNFDKSIVSSSSSLLFTNMPSSNNEIQHMVMIYMSHVFT